MAREVDPRIHAFHVGQKVLVNGSYDGRTFKNTDATIAELYHKYVDNPIRVAYKAGHEFAEWWVPISMVTSMEQKKIEVD